MATDRELLLMSEDEFKAFRSKQVKEKKQKLRSKIKAAKGRIQVRRKFGKAFNRLGKKFAKALSARPRRRKRRKAGLVLEIEPSKTKEIKKSIFFR